MPSRAFFAIAAATLLWALPAGAWEPEIVGLDSNDSPASGVTSAAIDGSTLVTPEMVGAARAEPRQPIVPNAVGSDERIARQCTCK